LYGLQAAPRVHGILAGVGGVNVSPESIASMTGAALASAPKIESSWIR
jgi:hypothetical protein